MDDGDATPTPTSRDRQCSAQSSELIPRQVGLDLAEAEADAVRCWVWYVSISNSALDFRLGYVACLFP